MKPTLFLLAAGMGSLYGGLKQLDGLGPNGATIMDYSIYAAIRAGRKSFRNMKARFRPNSYSKAWTRCQKASPAPKAA